MYLEACESQNSVDLYLFLYKKSVVNWSEKSVRFEFFMETAFEIGQILWDFTSQCEIWHVWILY